MRSKRLAVKTLPSWLLELSIAMRSAHAAAMSAMILELPEEDNGYVLCYGPTKVTLNRHSLVLI